LKALNSLLSLFDDAEQIEINYQNKSTYLFLSFQFDSTYLKSICFQVTVIVSQNFSFTSERFLYIYQRTLSTLFDFTVYINEEPFSCNSVFASCLSRAIFDLKLHDSTVQEIHFNDIKFGDDLVSLSQILNGHSFLFSSSEINSIQSAIDLIGIISFSGGLKAPTTFQEAVHILNQPTFINYEEQCEQPCHFIAEHFSNLTEFDFHSLTTRALKRILSSEVLRLPTENS
jgi:hypothetical protein